MSFRALLLFTVTAAACFDPLYEDGAPLTSGWVLCCNAGAVNTCFCADASSCQQSLFACAAGRCSSTPVCGGSGGGSGGGAATGGGGGAAGGGGGTIDAGLLLDAGVSDGGTIVDAGVPDSGTGGGAGGGGGGNTGFEFCCVNSRVTTCTCPFSGCTGSTFRPCPGGTCVAAEASCG